MDASGFEDEDLDEEANPLEPRSVMKSSSEATHRHLGASTGFGDNSCERRAFRTEILEDLRMIVEKVEILITGLREGVQITLIVIEIDINTKDEISGGYRDGSYRRFDREDRDFGRDYEDFDHRRNLDRGGWRDGGNRNWNASQGRGRLDEPLRFTGAHFSSNSSQYGKGLSTSRPESPFGGSPEGAKRLSGSDDIVSSSPARTVACPLVSIILPNSMCT